MARMQPELRKQELMDIAFRQFLQHGYEKTSIRSIVGEANGEIGMFYHHFVSKEEIFHAVLEQYNIAYIKKFEHVMREEKESCFWDLLERVLLLLESALNEYKKMNQGAADAQMLMILHQNTLMSLKPIFCELIHERIQRGEISPPQMDVVLLTDFLLFGISAVIHGNNEKSAEVKKEAIKKLLCRLLGIMPH